MTIRSQLRRRAPALARVVRRWRSSHESAPVPPRCPPGWRIGPPDFVGVGAQKAGTSWWFSLLRDHPQVHYAPALPKELHYFDRYFDGEFSDLDVANYHRFFPRPAGGISGEWTPGYLADFWALPMLRRAAPDARILVLLRNPVERYRSGLTHTRDSSSRSLRRASANGAFHRGLYAQQLERLLELFPRDQVLVQQYEQCRAQPMAELERTLRFLGLDPAGVGPQLIERRVNETVGDKIPLGEPLRRTLVAAYATEVDRLAALLPDLDLSLWADFQPDSR